MSVQRKLTEQLLTFGHTPIERLAEDQESICAWAATTPFAGQSYEVILLKFQEEAQELVEAPKTLEGAGKEIGDCFVMLAQLAQELGYEIEDLVDSTMHENHRRKWEVREDGTGKHV